MNFIDYKLIYPASEIVIKKALIVKLLEILLNHHAFFSTVFNKMAENQDNQSYAERIYTQLKKSSSSIISIAKSDAISIISAAIALTVKDIATNKAITKEEIFNNFCKYTTKNTLIIASVKAAQDIQESVTAILRQSAENRRR